MARAGSIFVFAALLISGPGLALAGDLPITVHTETATLAGESIDLEVYVPELDEPAPILVVAHGFQRSPDDVAPWGEALARRGYVAAVPSFPSGLGGFFPDHEENGVIISELLDWMAAMGESTDHFLGDRVDPDRRGALGHSAGGLSSVLAAAYDPAIDVVVGLDLVDGQSNEGLAAAPSVTAATALLMSEPDSCNSDGNGSDVYDALAGPRLHLRVIGADHCDPESPTSSCTALFVDCGVADPEVHEIFRSYAFATIDHILACDEQAASHLGGEDAEADDTIKDLHADGFPLDLDCGDDDGGGGDDDGNGGGDDSSCGCGASSGSRSGFLAPALLAVLLALRPPRWKLLRWPALVRG